MQANKKIYPLKLMFKNLTEKDLNWCLGIFVSWMRIIGIDPNIPKTKDWRWLVWFIQRWTCLFLSVGVNVYVTFSFYQKVNRDSKKNNSTLIWTQWLDYITTAFHSISTHLCLLTYVTNHWNDLRLAMNKAEYINSDSRIDRVYPRLRKIIPLAICAIILMVTNILLRIKNLYIFLSRHI